MNEYWVTMHDRDGGDDEPEGPFDTLEEAQRHARDSVDSIWVTYEIFGLMTTLLRRAK